MDHGSGSVIELSVQKRKKKDKCGQIMKIGLGQLCTRYQWAKSRAVRLSYECANEVEKIMGTVEIDGQ
jgi:hypothetical protein